MKAQSLKNAILQLAVQGKLVPQNPQDEPASELLKKIKAEKAKLIKEKKIKAEKPLAPITDEEKPFDIPDSWEWVRLGEIGFTNIGLTYKPEEISNSGICVLRSNNIQNGKICYDDIIMVNKGVGEKLLVNVGDILICARNGSRNLVGKAALIEQDGMTFGAFMAIYRCECNQYIHKFILSQLFRNQLGGANTTTINQITQDMLKNIVIPLPSLAEQQRIVEKIEQLMPLVEKYDSYEKELSALEAKFPDDLKKSVLQFAVQGKLVPQNSTDESASELLKKIKAEKAKLIKEKKIKAEKSLVPITDEEKPFDIPNSWEWVRLGELVYNLGQKKPDENFYYIDVGSINNAIGIVGECSNIEPQNAPSRARKLVEDGCVIYSTVRPYLLNIAIVDNKDEKELIASTAFAIMQPFTGLYNKYLYHYLRSRAFVDFVNSQMIGVAYPAINDEKLFNGLLPLPPLAEQQRIVQKVEQILSLCDMLADESKLKKHQPPKRLAKVIEFSPIETENEHEHLFAARADEISPETRTKEQERLALLRKKR